MADHFYGISFVLSCSPPFGALHGTDYAGTDGNVYRACVGDTAGAASQYSSFDDGATTSEGVHNPVLSPDETAILFEVLNPSTGYFEIWVVDNVPGSTATQLLASASTYFFHPYWHPDSNQFTFVQGAPAATPGGSAAALAGGTVKKSSVSAIGSIDTLKAATGGLSPFRPSFNFDGSLIAYMFDQDVGSGSSQLRVMDADGTNDSSLDTIDRYRFQGFQHSWAHQQNTLAYDDGATGANAAYIIESDGTGKTQINAAGEAVGALVRVSDRAWATDDTYVVIAVPNGLIVGSGQAAMKALLDGSNTTSINAFNGSWGQDYFRQVLVADNRVWFIESATKLSSFLLADGTDYRVDLTIDGAQMDDFSTGDGWYFD